MIAINNQRKKVSIIIPCWNAEAFLPDLLDSIFAQTYQNIEVVCVDDHSTDNTIKVLQHYQKSHENMIVASHEVHKRQSAARNTGFDLSSGEYILFCDADDAVTPDYVQTLVENLEQNDADVSICGFKRMKDTKSLKTKSKHSKHKIKLFVGEQIIPEFFRQKTFDVCTWNKLFKKSLLQKYNLRFDESVFYAEDVEFNYFYFKHCDRIVYDSKICYFYIRRPSGLVKTPLNKQKLTCLTAFENMVEDSKNHSPALLTYTMAWRALGSVEILYYVFKYKNRDAQLAQKLFCNIREGVPFLKKAKRMVWHRRHLVWFVLPAAKILLPQLRNAKLFKK